MKKKLLKVLAVLVVLVLAVVIVGVLMLNSIVKTAVQSAGTSATGVETTLGGVDVSLIGGSANLKDFSLGQPEGFGDGSLFSLDGADVQIESGTLLSDTIVVPTVRIDGAHLTVSSQGTKLNIFELLSEIKKRSAGDDADADDASTKKVIIRDLRITNTTVTGSIGILPGQDPIELDLKIPDIHRTDIGSDGSGVKLDDAIGLVLETVVLNAGEAMKQFPGLGDLENLVGDVGAQATEALDKVGGEATKALEGAGEGATKAIEEGLGGLLGGNKDEAE